MDDRLQNEVFFFGFAQHRVEAFLSVRSPLGTKTDGDGGTVLRFPYFLLLYVLTSLPLCPCQSVF